MPKARCPKCGKVIYITLTKRKLPSQKEWAETPREYTTKLRS